MNTTMCVGVVVHVTYLCEAQFPPRLTVGPSDSHTCHPYQIEKLCKI